jgi:hypothetical protein
MDSSPPPQPERPIRNFGLACDPESDTFGPASTGSLSEKQEMPFMGVRLLYFDSDLISPSARRTREEIFKPSPRRTAADATRSGEGIAITLRHRNISRT